jgi:hypothetical protein
MKLQKKWERFLERERERHKPHKTFESKKKKEKKRKEDKVNIVYNTFPVESFLRAPHWAYKEKKEQEEKGKTSLGGICNCWYEQQWDRFSPLIERCIPGSS